MKLTIVPSDGIVYIDSVGYNGINLSFIPAEVHALQWKDPVGWIEYIDGPDGLKTAPNEIINTLPDWANKSIALWDVAKSNTPSPQPTTTGTQVL